MAGVSTNSQPPQAPVQTDIEGLNGQVTKAWVLFFQQQRDYITDLQARIAALEAK